jgi:uncharacterized protein (TIGR04255 family)
MAVLEKAQFSAEDLAENFPNAPLSEASYEIRFEPKLRIPAEVWRLQEQVGAACPNFSVENTLVLGGTLMPSYTFASRDRTTIVRVSQQNLGIIMTSYPGFSEFHQKVVEWTGSFCAMYGVESIARAGLRYVNNIILPRQAHLGDYVNPFVDLSRFSSDTKNGQFVCEIRSAISDHDLMIRTALIKEPIPSYILDIDCYVERSAKPADVPSLLTRFHESAKVTFLEHIRLALKAEFRRRTK